jgi:hypothetical protein
VVISHPLRVWRAPAWKAATTAPSETWGESRYSVPWCTTTLAACPAATPEPRPAGGTCVDLELGNYQTWGRIEPLSSSFDWPWLAMTAGALQEGHAEGTVGGIPSTAGAARPTAADCKSVGVCLPRFESLTHHAAETAPGQHGHGPGPAVVVSGAVLVCPAVHG